MRRLFLLTICVALFTAGLTAGIAAGDHTETTCGGYRTLSIGTETLYDYEPGRLEPIRTTEHPVEVLACSWVTRTIAHAPPIEISLPAVETWSSHFILPFGGLAGLIALTWASVAFTSTLALVRPQETPPSAEKREDPNYFESEKYKTQLEKAEEILKDVRDEYEKEGKPSETYKKWVKNLDDIKELTEVLVDLQEATSPELTAERRKALLNKHLWELTKKALEFAKVPKAHVYAIELGFEIGTPIGEHFKQGIETLRDTQARTKAVFLLRDLTGDQSPQADYYYNDGEGEHYYYRAKDKAYFSRNDGGWFTKKTGWRQVIDR